eukprot:CAMPEP_0204618314 /NCGR_PEP_ID=MMETSP0717-20131115/4999_1 /ASSEMBLY_ACC=CAM_ASM_000666 /TAXON_ID=230516 /ORGANISM="Chaetoceros curvisetus" /LENGTH=262 /DNA_ID=CAMNT_0051632019 /DNA_START=50 /DNA_END=838 /DNA_ORIENTATION=+
MNFSNSNPPAPAALAPTANSNNAPPPPFGVIFPGNQVITNFIGDPSGTKFKLTIPFTNITSMEGENSPAAVSDIVFFLLPNISLPPNTGAMLYWQASPIVPIPTNSPFANMTMNNESQDASSGFELLGALTPNKTSAVFTTGWSTHEALLSMISKVQQNNNNMGNDNNGINITLGVSMEPLTNIANLSHMSDRGVDERKHVAKRIATDLFNYLQSFDDRGTTGVGVRPGMMVVPNNVFDRWLKRFEGKIARDPNFFMKSRTD